MGKGCQRQVPMIGRELAGAVLGMILLTETLKSYEDRPRRKKRPEDQKGECQKLPPSAGKRQPSAFAAF